MTSLVATPAIRPGESFWGYVLRLSEANRHETPYWIFREANIEQGHMFGPSLDTATFAANIGLNVTDLVAAAPLYTAGSNIPTLLGQPLTNKAMRIDKPRICPDCIQEHGYIRAEWDLKLVTACEYHQRSLVSICPQCGRPLSWFRRGMLTCRCNGDLTSAPSTSARPDVAALAGIVGRKLLGRPLEQNCRSGFPTEALQEMSLRTLLSLIPKLGAATGASAGGTPEALVEGAARLLSDWPNQFVEFLDHKSLAQNTRGRGVRKQFENLFSSFFKAGFPEDEVQFLREAFITFGHTRSGNVDTKLYRGERRRHEATAVSTSELSRRLGVTPSKIRSLQGTGWIPCETHSIDGASRTVFDLQSITIDLNMDAYLPERQAGALIGIPPLLLRQLRNSGLFKVGHIGPNIRYYHRNDLSGFASRLRLSARAPSAAISSERVSLGHLLFSASLTRKEKELILKRIIEHSMPAALSGHTIRAIEINRDALDRSIGPARAAASGNRLSYAKTANLLGCCPMVIEPLANLGYLELQGHAPKRVTVQSAEAFRSTYVSTTTIARHVRGSPRRLARELTLMPVETFSVPRNGTGIPQSFVNRASLLASPYRLSGYALSSLASL